MTRGIIFKNDSKSCSIENAKFLVLNYEDSTLKDTYNLEKLYIRIKYDNNKIVFSIFYYIKEIYEDELFCIMLVSSLQNDPDFKIKNNTLIFDLKKILNYNEKFNIFNNLGIYNARIEITINTNSMNRFLRWTDKNSIFNN